MTTTCCAHFNLLELGTFRQLIYDKLCDADSDSSPIDLGTVRGVARANASTHFKIGKREQLKKAKRKKLKKVADDDDDGSKNAMLLHCEECSMIDGGRNEKQLELIYQRANMSSLGGLCNNKLWICMHCAKVLGSEHAKQHIQDSESCHMLLQCHDSHVYCATCCSYQYPREVGGDNESNDYLDPIVYEWLIVYGKLRLWWRSVDEGIKQQQKKQSNSGGGMFGKLFSRGKNKRNVTNQDNVNNSGCDGTIGQNGQLQQYQYPTMNKKGIKNYGNTCFFTSTCQALLSIPPLVAAIENHPSSSDYPVQHSLKLFIEEYKSKASKKELRKNGYTIDPRNIWNTVQEHALFGNYDENTMEDARSLWLDIQDSLDPLMKRKFFDYSTEKKMECSCCESLGKWERVSTDTVLQVQVKPEHEMDADEAKQHNEMERHCIGMDDAPINVQDMIQNVFLPENMTDYKCDNCKEIGGCRLMRRLTSLPKIMIVQINRSYQLEYVRPAFSFKCHRRVICPDTMELSPLLSSIRGESEKEDGNSSGSSSNVSSSSGSSSVNISSSSKKRKNQMEVWYQLCGLNVHDGGLGGGHNMAYRLNAATNEWSWFSDQHFGTVSKEEVDAAEPSLAFYVRLGNDHDVSNVIETKQSVQKCKAGCGFFGKEDQDWYCSQCARKMGYK